MLLLRLHVQRGAIRIISTFAGPLLGAMIAVAVPLAMVETGNFDEFPLMMFVSHRLRADREGKRQ